MTETLTVINDGTTHTLSLTSDMVIGHDRGAVWVKTDEGLPIAAYYRVSSFEITGDDE